MLLIVDNYDSFTFNLVHYFQELGATTRVIRNDAMSAAEALSLDPAGIVLSPGPCDPDRAGICLDLIGEAPASLPILGVCLGHQAIGQAFGGEVVSAMEIMHGKTSAIEHDGTGVFAGLSNPFTATRYHSLAVRPDSVPECLQGDGADAGWRDHGAEPSQPSGPRCAIPPRVNRVPARSRPAGEFPRPDRPATRRGGLSTVRHAALPRAHPRAIRNRFAKFTTGPKRMPIRSSSTAPARAPAAAGGAWVCGARVRYVAAATGCWRGPH